jgi:hypothetical protein
MNWCPRTWSATGAAAGDARGPGGSRPAAVPKQAGRAGRGRRHHGASRAPRHEGLHELRGKEGRKAIGGGQVAAAWQEVHAAGLAPSSLPGSNRAPLGLKPAHDGVRPVESASVVTCTAPRVWRAAAAARLPALPLSWLAVTRIEACLTLRNQNPLAAALTGRGPAAGPSVNRGVLNLSKFFFLNLSKLWGVLNLSKFCLNFF